MNKTIAAKELPDPPLMVCLHCRWYTAAKHFCCKHLLNPTRKPLSSACDKWAISDDAKRAWSGAPANAMERWAQNRLREKLREMAYGGQNGKGI